MGALTNPSPQKAVNLCWIHFIVNQNPPAFDPEGRTLYMVNDLGYPDPIALLIFDLYQAWMDAAGLDDLLSHPRTRDRLRAFNRGDLLHDLRLCHDQKACANRRDVGNFRKEFQQDISRIANCYALNDPAQSIDAYAPPQYLDLRG